MSESSVKEADTKKQGSKKTSAGDVIKLTLIYAVIYIVCSLMFVALFHTGLLKGMKGRWDNSNGKKQFHVCLNIAGNRYEIAFDRDFVYNSIDSLAV